MSEAEKKVDHYDPTRLSSETFKRMCTMFSEHTHPLYLQFDDEMKISAIWGDPTYYGLIGLESGQSAEENIEFLVGVEIGDDLELPIISTPNGQPASVFVKSSDDSISVIVLDASTEQRRQQEIQQKSNEVQLLARRQQQLMRELKQTHQELEQKRAEADRANIVQSEFISNMSHEFRTPLTSVLGYADLLEKSLRNEKIATDRLRAITRGANHLLALIENLLDHGQLRQDELLLQPRTTDLTTIVNDVHVIVDPLAAEKNLEFTIDTDDSVNSPLLIDGLRYRQIVINLLGNATKFTRSGNVGLHIRWRDGTLTTKVTDTGEGVSPEAKEKIFAPFERVMTTQEAGAGLGLSISRRLARLMGGDLTLESSVQGKGSTFSFSIDAPLDPEAQTIASTATAITDNSDASIGPANSAIVGRRLLLAEDDDDIASLVVAVLEGAGYTVDRASNGEEALEMVRVRPPTAILLDMNMPIMDGVETVKSLRERGFLSPAIALSASASSSARERAMSAGCDDYLIKPIDMATLIDAIDRHIGRPN